MTDLSWALKNLKLVNKLVSETELKNIFILGEYNYLQMYQPLIFLDLRNYYKTKYGQTASGAGMTPGEGSKNIKKPQYFKLLLPSLGIMLISFLAFVATFLTRKKVIVFSSDKVSSKYNGDFRIEGIYSYLNTSNTQFTEFFHTVISVDFFKNLLKRKRLAFYMESIDILYGTLKHLNLIKISQFDFENVDLKDFGEDKKFIRALLYTYARAIHKSEFKIRVLERVLAYSGVTTLLTIDTVRRYGELIAACRLTAVRTYAFQHGQFTKYQVGWLAASRSENGALEGNILKPEKLFVWSLYWKNELKKLGTYFSEAELEVAGNPKGKAAMFSLPTDSDLEDASAGGATNAVNILIPFETDAPKVVVQKYIQKFLACPQTTIYFKVRPDVSVDFQKESYGLSAASKRVFVVSDIADCMSKIDIVAGVQSTFLYDCIYYLKPVLIMKTELDYAESMVENGLAEMINIEEDDVCAVLAETKKTSPEILKTRKVTLFGERDEGIYPNETKETNRTPDIDQILATILQFKNFKKPHELFQKH